MIISFLRALIIYLIIILSLRFMGKRQIGELQPTELAVTILISEIAAIPLDDTDSPLLSALIPVVAVICLEVIISGINMQSVKFRRLITGKPIVVINNGKIQQQALKSTRISVSDLLDYLRLKGFFDIQDVKFAIVEMNGQLSVMPKEDSAPLTKKDMKIKAESKEIPYTVISDGEIIDGHFKDVGIDENDIQKQLAKEKLALKEVMLMTCDKNKKYFTVKREKNL